jgi:two-component system, cell cycle sensor histidine kinase and response regulator CckA
VPDGGDRIFRKLVEGSAEVVARTDPGGRCIYVSPSVREVLGYDPEELVGRIGFVELAHPEDRPEREQTLERYGQGKTSGSPVRTRFRRKDGVYVWLETRTHVVRDAEGRIVEVQSWSHDVTTSVLTERALTERQANFRALLDRMPEGVVVHRDGSVLYANPRFLRMTGRDPAEDLVGASISDLVHPDAREELARRLATPDRPSFRSPKHYLLCRGGAPLLIEVTALPLMFEGTSAFIVTVYDVTEQAIMEERLAAAERLASIGRLASGVGHEINNPLAYMMLNLELAQADLEAIVAEGSHDDRFARLAECWATVREGAERVRDIVRDLKLLSSTSGDQTGPVDVHHALEVAMATTQHETRLRARVAAEGGPLPPALGSEGRLVQVFVNLLLNAAQAIPEGDVNGNEIRVRTREEAERIIVEIEDTGAGISPEDLPRIFEPFFTTKANGAGRGLGLSISHNIVAAYGGTLTAERASRRGTLFRVTLQATGNVDIERPEPPRRTAAPERRLRVLVVDDEPSMTRILTHLLQRHKVTAVGCGRQAIAQLATDPSYDVIVCDLQMKEGDGVDVYEYLREHGTGLARRMIFTTGGAFTDRARDFLATCDLPVLEKPYDAARLETLIAEVARNVLPR